MLWSLIKILIFVAIVAALTLGAVYLLETEGGLQITAGGEEYTLGPLHSVIGALLLILIVWVFLKLFSLLIATLRFLNGDETAISRYFDRNRERKGFQALSEGMMALASGEGRLAMAKASKAERYLQKPELTDLITAQAAEMSGDRAKAEQVYKKLIQNDATRFVGVRGIMKQKLAAGETDVALKLAERAFAIKPQHEETQDVLLQLQAQSEDWSGARKTLNAKLKSGTMPRDVHKRRDAVLALSEAKDVLEEGKTIDARVAAIEANRLSPDLIPAAVLAAQGYIEQGKPRYAIRVLKKAWEVRPHPEIAGAFAAIVPDETPQARLKRFQQLVKLQPDHRETKLLMAELNIAAEDFPAARRALGKLHETDADARVLTVMAAIERGEGASDTVVKGWLAKAVTAPRGPQWVCDNCHSIHTSWAPVCANCQSFDTLSWTVPNESQTAAPTGVGMLPLIVGALEDKTEEPPEADVIETPAEPEEAEIVEPESAEAQPGPETGAPPSEVLEEGRR